MPFTTSSDERRAPGLRIPPPHQQQVDDARLDEHFRKHAKQDPRALRNSWASEVVEPIGVRNWLIIPVRLSIDACLH